MNDKEICKRTNLIIKELDKFSETEIYPKLNTITSKFGIDAYEDLKDLFLTGAWYGIYKAIQLNLLKKEQDYD